MTGDLAERLARAAGPVGSAPDLGVLWERGCGRRRRRQVGRGLGAIAAVATLVVGGLALAGGDGDAEGVVAGPGSSQAPPAEPTDLAVRMVVEAGPSLDGIPTLAPGDPVTISYLGYDGWVRGVSVDWEAWDGSSWTWTHTLVLGSEPDGSGGEVVPAEDDLMVHAAGMLGSGPDLFPTPSDVEPGWYRVCVEVSGGGDGDVSGEEPTGVSSSVPPPSSEVDSPPGRVRDPEAGEGSSPRPLRPCAQVRVAPTG